MRGGTEEADARPGSPGADDPDFIPYPYYQFRDSCRWGHDCDRHRHDVCGLKHPGDKGYVATRLIRCRFGNSCVFLEAGRCLYYHGSRAQATQRSGRAASPGRISEMEERGSRAKRGVEGSFSGRSVKNNSGGRERSISISPSPRSRSVSSIDDGLGSLLKTRSRSRSRGRPKIVDGRYRDDDARWRYDRGNTGGVRPIAAHSRSRSRSRGGRTSASWDRAAMRDDGRYRAARMMDSRGSDREHGADDSKFLMDVIKLQQETIMRLSRERDAAVGAAEAATSTAIFTSFSNMTAADAPPARAHATLPPVACLTIEPSSYMLPQSDYGHSHKYSSSSHYTYNPMTTAGYTTQANSTTISPIDASPPWTHMHLSTRPARVEDRRFNSRDGKACDVSGSPKFRSGSPW